MQHPLDPPEGENNHGEFIHKNLIQLSLPHLKLEVDERLYIGWDEHERGYGGHGQSCGEGPVRYAPHP